MRLLDCEPAGGLARIQARGDAPNAVEQAEQLGVVGRMFLGLQRPFIRKMDASCVPEIVWSECRAEFDRLIR